jgi:hypothetical protein
MILGIQHVNHQHFVRRYENGTMLFAEDKFLESHVTNNDCMLSSQYAVVYEGLLEAARAESETNVALILREQLPFKWRELYVSTATGLLHALNDLPYCLSAWPMASSASGKPTTIR